MAEVVIDSEVDSTTVEAPAAEAPAAESGDSLKEVTSPDLENVDSTADAGTVETGEQTVPKERLDQAVKDWLSLGPKKIDSKRL